MGLEASEWQGLNLKWSSFYPGCWREQWSVGSGGVGGRIGDELCPVYVELELWWTIQSSSALPRAG